MANEKREIKKPNGWMSSFNIVGKVKPNDGTFGLNQSKENSSWVYNRMNLGVNCGEKFGTIFCDLMGGYDTKKPSVIYAFGKNENGGTDFNNSIEVDWNDRNNDKVLEQIGDLSFITVGLEKTADGKTYYKKFLAAYDAIAYIQEHLSTEEDTVVRVKGRLKYNFYNDKVQVQKEITSIVLSTKEPDGYGAFFTQSILLDKESAKMTEVDKKTGVLVVNGTVLDYLKEIKGVEYKGIYPYMYNFEFEFDLTKPELVKKVYEKVFKVKKNYTMVTFEGKFIENGAAVLPSYDELSDDIKELIEMGLYDKEEALQKCADNGNRTRRMVLTKPLIRKNDKDIPVVQKFEDAFADGDLDVVLPDPVTEEEEIAAIVEDNPVTNDGDMSWLDELGDDDNE